MKQHKIQIYCAFFKNAVLKRIIVFAFLLMLLVYGCDLVHSELMYVYRFKITVVTDIELLRIGDTFLTQENNYPYTLLEIESPSVRITVYPVLDTGYIKFKLFSGEAFNNPIAYLRDSLTILTPIDTTQIGFRSGHGNDTIIVYP